MNHALELRNLTKSYDDFTLDRVSLALPKGCMMGFIGENGAGKSTTIKLILDLVHRDGGEILIDGRPNTERGVIGDEIGVVLDECRFPETLNLTAISSVLGSIYRAWNANKFQELCKRFRLPEKKPVKDYSRGMTMKLSIAAALSHDPKLLILDEATSGLDPVMRDEILDVFQDFLQDERHAIFMSSHILSDLEKVCDYIAFLHRGRLKFCMEKDILLQRYGILKCSEAELKQIDPSLIAGVRHGQFGVQALVLRDALRNRNLIIDRAGIEDIMLFYVKEDSK